MGSEVSRRRVNGGLETTCGRRHLSLHRIPQSAARGDPTEARALKVSASGREGGSHDQHIPPLSWNCRQEVDGRETGCTRRCVSPRLSSADISLSTALMLYQLVSFSMEALSAKGPAFPRLFPISINPLRSKHDWEEKIPEVQFSITASNLFGS
ncbi:hypothetical protein SKAU_G00346520 [Synaphobranchus kaupii]|uniref:Uncharacterized protein n=1 Tax=Synaphobranchus kaupii TaxID=118154 RepID=A0A9Q1IHT0_SYNKA|nr:hypothetical protein SKAU_G00346520 [Synaphobranchus kaupii]